MATLNLKHIYQQLSTMNDPVVIELFDALISEIGRLQDRIATLEDYQRTGMFFGEK